MAFVYVLRSLKNSYQYIGSTRQSLEERLTRHNSGHVASTKGKRPFILLHSESFDNYTDARKRELYFKSGSGREHLRRLLEKKRAGGGVVNRTRL